MFITLVAVITALVLGHFMPQQLATLRGFGWYARYLHWWGRQSGAEAVWRGPYGLSLAVVPLALAVLVVQLGLSGHWLGLPSLLLGVAALVGCWGPRDLDHDVEAVIDADDAGQRAQAITRLAHSDGHIYAGREPGLVEAVAFAAKRRWFAPLFWFFIAGPVGVVVYRLSALTQTRAFAGVLPAGNAAGAARWVALLEWPVEQLMALAMALVGNFDTVLRAWSANGGKAWALGQRHVEAAAVASVGAELQQDAVDYADDGLVGQELPLPELRDAMSLVWRMLLLWMVLLALLILAGWIG